MILAGDELGHTQQGNNNAYCQDNELTWLHWDLNKAQQALLRFVQKCIALVNSQPVLQRRRFFHNHAFHGGEAPDIAWLDTFGNEMSEEDWQTSFVRCFGVQLFGQAVDIDERGEEINGDTLLLLFNADHEVKIDFVLPALEADERWQLLLDTALPEDDSQRLVDGALTRCNPHRWPCCGSCRRKIPAFRRLAPERRGRTRSGSRRRPRSRPSSHRLCLSLRRRSGSPGLLRLSGLAANAGDLLTKRCGF